MRISNLAIPLLTGAVGVSGNEAIEEQSVKRVAIIGKQLPKASLRLRREHNGG
jgi:hypothetical protein